MTDPHMDLVRAFIADESEAFAERRQGKFWPRNHHRIAPLAGDVSGLSASGERTDFYFHFMRVSGSVPLVSDEEMPFLVEAYRRLLPFLDLGGTVQMGRRHILLFIFGFDDAGGLPSGETVSAKALKARLKLVTQLGKYTTQPAQREKRSKLLAFAGEAERILETLRHLGYRHDRRYGEDRYDVVNLDFWGMVLVGLLNRTTRTDLVADMVEGEFGLVQRDRQLAMLHRYVEAVLPDVEPDETAFLSLAQRLAEIALARRNGTESVRLAERLDLPFEPDEDWEILISIPLRGSGESPLAAKNLAQLRIRPDPDWQWDITARVAERGRYSESERASLQNDLDFPVLGPGNLHAFPAWLTGVREKTGLDFDAGAADIRVGRKRAAAKLIARWLAS